MGEGFRVLHVDDDPEFADLTATCLEREDERFSVETATSGAECLDRLTGDVDCVVSDYDMPGTNGIELLRAVREEYPDLPFVLCTGKGSEEIASEAISAGVTDYLRKRPGAEQFELLANRIGTAVGQYRAEQELERQNDLFAEVQDLADVGAWEWCPPEESGYISDQVYEIYGVESHTDRDPESDIREFYHPDDRETIREAFARAVETGEPYDVEVRVITPDGTTKWVRTRGDPQFEDGTCVRIRGSIQDVTERKERERSLERQNDRLADEIERRELAESRYRSLFENFPEPTVAYVFEDGKAHVARVNDAFTDVFGYTAEEAVGEHIDDLVVPPDRREEARRLDERVRAGDMVDEDLRREAADGLRDFRFRNIRLSGDEEIDGYAVYADITGRKRQEQELRKKNERLEQFASVLSHDLRNPLAVLDGSLDLAERTGEAEHFERCRRAVDRMERLIEDILTVAREGEDVDETEPDSLAEVAEECWETIATAGATLVVETDSVVRADRSRLKQLLENLFQNAVQHGGKTVTVGGTDGGFYVADDGPGIPESDRADVFEFGYSSTEGGTGLGLYIVEEVAEAHGWTVGVGESDDGGARFEITGVGFEN